MKMRKSKYTPELNSKMLKFFDKAYFVTVKGKETPNELPTFEKFAKTISITTRTLRNWRDAHNEFDEIYQTCKDLQTDFLLQNGLRGLYNPTVTIFALKNISGWRDKQIDERDFPDIVVKLPKGFES